jgi:hypothetical protein
MGSSLDASDRPEYLTRFISTGHKAQTTTEKGKTLEELICYVFGLVPGITITRRNTMNVFQ